MVGSYVQTVGRQAYSNEKDDVFGLRPVIGFRTVWPRR